MPIIIQFDLSVSETAQGMIGYIEQPEDPLNLPSEQPSVQESTVVHGEILAPESNCHTLPETQLLRISTMFMVNKIKH